ncbi:class I SAM-dependent methyltransferase [Candidatus Woesearchaeota archaeon]|nr:class I SAM-dependent methyltransferase [Candidatus Woesearchaeota archaeon]
MKKKSLKPFLLKPRIPWKIRHLFYDKIIYRIRILFALLSGRKAKCICCGWAGNEFLPYNQTNNYSICPNCGSHKRHRLLCLYLNKTLPKKKKIKLLHFAPEKSVTKFLREEYKNLDYLSVDLDSSKPFLYNVMKKEDITRLSLKDNSFDIIICMHVLEHVLNDKKAMSEIRRVLKKNGFAIIQSHMSSLLYKTKEDFTIKDPEKRKKMFGEEDHWRVYGKDYKKKLEEQSFTVIVNKFAKTLNNKTIREYCLDRKENLYLCFKNKKITKPKD